MHSPPFCIQSFPLYARAHNVVDHYEIVACMEYNFVYIRLQYIRCSATRWSTPKSIYIYIYISCFDKPFIQTTLSPICLTIDSDYKSRYQIRQTSHGKRHHGVWNQIHTLFTSLWKSPTNKTSWHLGTFLNLNLINITLSVFDTCFVDRPHTSRVVAYFKIYMFKWQFLSLA